MKCDEGKRGVPSEHSVPITSYSFSRDQGFTGFIRLLTEAQIDAETIKVLRKL